MPKIHTLLFLIVSVASGSVFADEVFVSLEKADALAVMDGSSGKLLQTFEIGKRPRNIVFSHDKKKLYVAVVEENTIKRVDPSSMTVVASFHSTNPKSIAISPDDRFLFSSNDAANQLAVIDIAQNKELKRIPIAKESEGISVSPDGKWIISTSESENLAQWIDATTFQVIDSTPVVARPRASQFTADGKQLWVTSENAAKLTVIDTATRQPLKILRFEIPGIDAATVKPVGIRIDQKQRFAYVALGRANRVAVIDVQKLEVVDYLPVGQRVWHLEFSPDQKRLYTANGISGDVSIIDLENHKVRKPVPVGLSPLSIAVKP
jgi:PQQ-dependent catabolism-associated beta-propeller protein